MVDLNQVTNGISKYIENEIIIKVPDWRKWVIGAGASLALQNVSQIFNQIKENPMIKTMNIIDANDRIDIDRLYAVFTEQARHGPVTFDVPLVGPYTMYEQDVNVIYQYIVGS